MATTLEAGLGLHLHRDARGGLRVQWRERDWLGPLGIRIRRGGRAFAWGLPDEDTEPLTAVVKSFQGTDDLGQFHGWELIWQAAPLPLRTTVRGYVELPLLVFRVEATGAAESLSTGEFATPSVGWPAFVPNDRETGGLPEDTRTYGHQYCEFALPVFGDADCTRFFFAPHRPPVVEPLLFVAPDGRTIALAPLDQFHEQIIAVPSAPEQVRRGVRCGWHGDLDEVPSGFASEMALWAGPSPRRVLHDWTIVLLKRHRTERPSRYADVGVGKLSYWTDNGAVYYYRTETGRGYESTLANVVDCARRDAIPIASVQLDSWFYPQRNLRPVGAQGATLVPPSGLVRWEPRPDLFPRGFSTLKRSLGGLPLILHSRHFSSDSPYVQESRGWLDGEYAHPRDPGAYDELLGSAAGWGAITYEQDWLIESFLGVRGLRQAPGRARAWQEALDASATRHGLTLQWCMASPADFFQTVTLGRVTSIRTSGDYRYLFDNGLHWVWFLHTNTLARALGLNPFKDVFLSHADDPEVDGEPHAEVEALLAALSTGPVGIGDRAGRTRRELVMRTCREDGVLVKPDVPIAALDRCFSSNSYTKPALLIGESHSAHPAGMWIYVVTLHASRHEETIRGRVETTELGALAPEEPVLAYDWRTRTWTRVAPGEGWDVALAFRDWDYRILCPILPGGRAVFGDVTKYATVGDRRIGEISATDGRIRFEVRGAANTWIEVEGCAPSSPVAARAGGRALTIAHVAEPERECLVWQPDSGRWVLRVLLQGEGASQVELEW